MTSAIIELRDYTLVPGTRDWFVELYEREFVESQIERGIDLIGTFRDADRDDRFVWFRGFPNAAARAKALDAFYTSELWKQHRESANACIVDSDNVLQLKQAWSGSGFAPGAAPPPRGAREAMGIVVATIFHFAGPVTRDFIAAFRETPQEGTALATLITDPQPNSYPRLTVREGENVLVHVALFDDARSARAAALPVDLERQAMRTEVRRLLPTPRSQSPT